MFGSYRRAGPGAPGSRRYSYSDAPIHVQHERRALGTFSDTGSGPAATGTLVNNATISGGKLLLPGGAGTISSATDSDHAELNAAAIAINTYTGVTFSIWATADFPGTNWQRLFDFGGQATINTTNGGNWIMATVQNAGGGPGFSISDVDLATAGDGNSNAQTVTGNPASQTQPGQLRNYMVTFDDATNTGRLYNDGMLVGVRTDMTNTLAHLQTTNAFIGASNWNGDPALRGSVTNFEVYNTALSPTDALALYFQGIPAQLGPRPRPPTGLRWRSTGAPGR